jgi:hypothetical protein
VDGTIVGTTAGVAVVATVVATAAERTGAAGPGGTIRVGAIRGQDLAVAIRRVRGGIVQVHRRGVESEGAKEVRELQRTAEYDR